ncbi:MAG TPA: glycosyltransferase [Planctomycetes bacterium]|nr:glycosyltransferase [Planctomycetota bacterium]
MGTTKGSLRILHVVHGFPPESRGGTEAYVDALCRAQQALGQEPWLLHGSFEPRARVCLEERKDLPFPAFRLHRADTYSDFWDRAHCPRSSALIARFLEERKPDFVHVHQGIRLSDNIVELAEGMDIPAALSIHDLSPSCPACFRLRPDDTHCEREVSMDSCGDCVPTRGHESPEEIALGIGVFRDNARAQLRMARAVIVATQATASLVLRGLGLAREDCALRLLPLAHERRFGGGAAEPRAQGGPLRLGFWGLITRRKGVDYLLQALGLLHQGGEEAPSIQLELFGGIDTEELKAELEDLAEGLPVRFHGRYEYPQLQKAGLDLAVFPSTCFETYGLVLDEAFELGIPAVVTDVGAFRERIGSGGFLVPPADPRALADLLRDLADNPSRVQEARKNLPQPGPLPEEHAGRILDIYREAMTRPRPKVQGVGEQRRHALNYLRFVNASQCPPQRRGL